MSLIYTDRKGGTHNLTADSTRISRKGAFVICYHKNHILFVEEAHGIGTPNLPGGGIDAGETPWQAAQREMIEEIGVSLPSPIKEPKESVTQHILYYADDDNQFWDYDQTYFIIKDDALEDLYFEGQRPAPANGKAEWIKLSDLDKKSIHAIHRNIIKELL